MPNLFSFDIPVRIDEPELIDDPDQPYEDFRSSMTDVRHANSLLGGTTVITRQTRSWLRSARHAGRSLTFLDVATGSCDIPEAVLKQASREGVEVHFTGLDFSAPILRFAREKAGHLPALRLVRGDAFRLPFADNSFDYALCSLAFHHFDFEQCLAALTEMERVSRRGWIVNDIRRAWSAWYLIRFISRIGGMNRLTRHDGPASVLRAYSVAEFDTMLAQHRERTGAEARIRRSLFYRVALIREK